MKIDICFGEILRRVDVQNGMDMDQLRTVIIREIPGLASAYGGLKLRYVDDEGDEILVTTTDELQEALRVGKQTERGILLLNLTVPGIDKVMKCTIENTAQRAAVSKAWERPKVTAATATTKIATTPTVTPTEPTTDVLQILKDAGASAVAEVNTALGSAASEIGKLFCELGTASTKQKETEKQLAAAVAQLAEETSKCSGAEQQVSHLKKQLSQTQTLLADARAQKRRDQTRLQDLEVQVAAAVQWENNFKSAEEERLRLNDQLQKLRNGLMVLSGSTTNSNTATAEVISTEAVPSSPTREPVPSPELPPPYEEPTVEEQTTSVPVDTITTITTTTPVDTTTTTTTVNQFPADCPAPSPLQLKMQRLREMGFNLTFDQLREKLVEHSDNMQHVINALL